MEKISEGEVEEMVDLELPDEVAEVTINSHKGCAEKIDKPAADHHFPSACKIIHESANHEILSC